MAGKRGKAVNRAKQERIVNARVAGRTVRDIAKSEGVNPTTVSAVSKRNAPLIARLTEQREEQLCAMHQAALDGIYKDLKARSGKIRQQAQIAALKYITAADRLRVAQENAAGQFTMSEVLMVAYQKHVVGA